MKSSDESDISDLQHTGREGRCSYMCERYARKPDMHTKTVAQKRGKEDYEEKVISINYDSMYGRNDVYCMRKG